MHNPCCKGAHADSAMAAAVPGSRPAPRSSDGGRCSASCMPAGNTCNALVQKLRLHKTCAQQGLHEERCLFPAWVQASAA